MMKEIVDCWIDDYSHMVQQAEQEQKEWEERCEQVQTDLRMIAKQIEFKAELLNKPSSLSEYQLKLFDRFLDSLNDELYHFREEWNA
jgi:hypothetical protein